MITINPYLNFNGNTEEAFLFYREVFGGDFEALQRYDDTPEKDNIPPDAGNKLMHVALKLGDNLLMGTDTLQSMGHHTKAGTNISLSIDTESEAEASRVFHKLAEGGTISVPLDKMFWGAIFGMLTDKFSIQWMVNCAVQPDEHFESASNSKAVL
jgi:PhnB protein